ncbi:MAG: sulfite exporter TauE/SafE family protein [Campylobacteraceae bacterium]|jgi:sulfite exporter TauE/SafE|nr:sulfite exporter TauE/SafE family protein [Campylobacteraceae bacterium]
MDAISLAAVIGAAVLGSSHCIGMCGGFVIALGSAKIDKSAALSKQSICYLAYHLGRISSYVLIGALCGAAGKVLSFSPKSQGFLLFVVGILMVLMGLSLAGFIRFLTSFESGILLKPWVKKLYNFLISSKNFSSFYLLGVFNGFIPCGLVYFFVSSAVASGSVFWGSMIMAIFGLCTLPALFAVSFITGFFAKIERIKDIMIKISGAIIVLYGIYMSYYGYLAVIKG